MCTPPPRGKVRFGVAGWSYRDWEGPIYGGRERGLELLCRHFDVVEINTTYYHPARSGMARGWLRQVAAAPAFEFTAKLWQGFTHRRELEPAPVAAYLAGLEPLREAGRLGALLGQFPASFVASDPSWDHLERLARTFSGWPLVVELRHVSWESPATLARLASLGLGMCNIDQPVFPGSSLGPTAHATSAIGYVRLHGRNAADWFRRDAGRDERYNYRYSIDELRPWVERLRRVEEATKQVYVITNNHFRGQAVVNALELRWLLGGENEVLPRRSIESFPSVARWAQAAPDREAQGNLFDPRMGPGGA